MQVLSYPICNRMNIITRVVSTILLLRFLQYRNFSDFSILVSRAQRDQCELLRPSISRALCTIFLLNHFSKLHTNFAGIVLAWNLLKICFLAKLLALQKSNILNNFKLWHMALSRGPRYWGLIKYSFTIDKEDQPLLAPD